jgi:isoleucyl-tRNA synthetase
MYEQLDTKMDFQAMEKGIAARWKKERTFEQSIENGGDEHVFYDGPPFPTGSPHYGTVFVSVLKDAVARYWTMKGKSVPRVWGWDCHGLPIENAVEKKLGITDKRQITEEIGVARFNAECRSLVSGYNDAWEEYIDRIGRWVDYEHPYKTLDRDYMESVIWVFAESYRKGLIYKDYRVTPYCYHCETSLSISDTRESDSTRPRQDPAVTIKFRSEKQWNGKPTFFLAWTTTPWTLPANLALAVGAEMKYLVLDVGDECLVLAAELFKEKEFPQGLRIAAELLGTELEGIGYSPLFPFYTQTENAFKVLVSDHVSTEEGTGIVHIAPAFGEDDYWVCRRVGIPVQNPVLADGTYSDAAEEFAGMNVHEANPVVIRRLKESGQVFKHETIEHNYPHCWRCRTPLIYRAMDAWYYNVEKIKPQLIAENEHINWIPETVKKGRFGKWLEGARDWNLSRNRYWGTPIPVWNCTDADCAAQWVPSSVEEIESRGGVQVDDLHIEFLDAVPISCECGAEMKRTPEVLDGWFESGAMPFAQCHYPFENKEWFEDHFPADFIIEYPGQIRGWFYYLHVLAVGILGRPAFRNCLVHGTLLAADGQKFSKSRKNYSDPLELMNSYGADALRIYLINSPAAVLGDLKFRDEDVKGQVRNLIFPLLNSIGFFTSYANIDGFVGDPEKTPDPDRPLDQWLLTRLSNLIAYADAGFEAYKLNEVIPQVLQFIDELSNWYIRRSRELFWAKGLSTEKKQAYETLYFSLISLVKILAPVAPFLSEYLFRLLSDNSSVHLESWPNFSFSNDKLAGEVELSRKIAGLGLSLRQKHQVNLRRPLKELQLCLPECFSDSELERKTIMEELNVKHLRIIEDFSELAEIRAVPDASKLGPVYGREVQQIIAQAKAGFVRVNDEKVEVFNGDKTWSLEPEEISIGYQGKDGRDVAAEDGIVLSFDFTLNDELIEEGRANELNRLIQNLRKETGYEVTDRIELFLEGDISDDWKQQLAESALAELKAIDLPDTEIQPVIDEKHYRIAVKRVS